jgi:aldehyde:ferredoxin oxidoreductase
MLNPDAFRILLVNLTEGKSKVIIFGNRLESIGGSGLAASLFEAYGKPDLPYSDSEQPIIFSIGPLTALYPLMSKCVMAFKSPYNGQFAESHAGGRLALAMRLAGYDAIVITGKAKSLTCLIIGGRRIEIRDVHYLAGFDVLATGKHLRKIFKSDSGHRSLVRIGPAGENGVAFAAVNVDTYRHFGRLGGGAAMGSKNLKAMMVLGDGSFE